VARSPQVSARELAKVLQHLGFKVISQRGSHIKLKRQANGATKTVIVPNHKVIRKGTLHSILRHAGLTPEQLRRFL